MHIPSVNFHESTKDKIREVERKELGEWLVIERFQAGTLDRFRYDLKTVSLIK